MNGDDLGHLVSLAKSRESELQSLTSGRLTDINNNLQRLQEQYDTLSASVVQLAEMQTSVTQITETLDTIFGTGSNRLTPRQIRQRLRTINTLRQRVDRLNEVK